MVMKKSKLEFAGERRCRFSGLESLFFAECSPHRELRGAVSEEIFGSSGADFPPRRFETKKLQVRNPLEILRWNLARIPARERRNSGAGTFLFQCASRQNRHRCSRNLAPRQPHRYRDTMLVRLHTVSARRALSEKQRLQTEKGHLRAPGR